MTIIFSSAAYEIFERPFGDHRAATASSSSDSGGRGGESTSRELTEALSHQTKALLSHEERLMKCFSDRTDFDALPRAAIAAAKMGLIGHLSDPAERRKIMEEWEGRDERAYAPAFSSARRRSSTQSNTTPATASGTPPSPSPQRRLSSAVTATSSIGGRTHSTLGESPPRHKSPAAPFDAETAGTIALNTADRAYRRACGAPRTLVVSRNGTLYICDEVGDLVLEAIPISEDVAAVKALLSITTRALPTTGGSRGLAAVREQHLRDAGVASCSLHQGGGGSGSAASATASDGALTPQSSAAFGNGGGGYPFTSTIAVGGGSLAIGSGGNVDGSIALARFGADFETIRRIDERNTVAIPLEVGEVRDDFDDGGQQQQQHQMILHLQQGYEYQQQKRLGGVGVGPQTPNGPQIPMTPPHTRRITFISSLTVEMGAVTLVTRHTEPLPQMPEPEEGGGRSS